MLFIYLDKMSQMILFVSVVFLLSSCNSSNANSLERIGKMEIVEDTEKEVIPGAENVAQYFPMLKDKTVAMVVNQTSRVVDKHLVDTLLTLGVKIKTIFSPEHGFRGIADAGEKVEDGKDSKTGLPVLSLYGKKKKPSSDNLRGIDVVVFDIQDVGARFYTYISSLHYIMEACAEEEIEVIVLDRPNPNAHYIDGPILEKKYTSFIGMHPVPIVYGMTIGEYAQMINGEQWLKNGVKAELTVIAVSNYTHDTYYNPPVKPSPNLPNIQSIFLYPSLCLLEGTHMSLGRGTDKQFQIYGHPKYKDGIFKFIPTSRAGAKYPKHENQICYGINLQYLTKGELHNSTSLNLSYLIDSYTNLRDQKEAYFLKNNFFEKLAGTDKLRIQIEANIPEAEIKSTWKKELDAFKIIRAKYLLYP